MKKLFCVFFLATFISCNQKVPVPQLTTIDNLYTLEIPPSFGALNQPIYPQADLELGNTFTQVYLVTTHQQDDILFETYIDRELSNYNKRKQYNIDAIETLHIGPLTAKVYELEMSQDQDYMYMVQAFIKGTKNYYQIISWTSAKNKTAQRQNLLNIITTFKEI